jgi:outer membrane protein W
LKKNILILTFLLTACAFAQISKTELKGKIGISLYGGVNIPASGDIASNISSTDLINPGPHFGLGVSYFFTEAIGVEAVFSYDVNIYADKFKVNGNQPSVSVTTASINGIYNFGRLLNNSRISPYVRAGVGSYNWRHLDDTPWREGEVVTINGIEQKATSFGINIGLGADYSIVKSLTLGAVVDYNMYFPKDEDKFGKDFGVQGNFTPKLKLCYYLPVH